MSPSSLEDDAREPGTPWLACIADDHTGATDVAAGLRRIGLRVGLVFGVPDVDRPLPDCDAVVVGLKIRTIPAADAVAHVLAVHERLSASGITECYSKYCSTFDSTDAGNIGPVSDALLDATGRSLAIACPTSPEHQRTVHQGHLFVGKRLLSDSPMRSHPLTPMTESNLVDVLGRQTRRPVGLVDHAAVRSGPAAVAEALQELIEVGCRHAVVDAATDSDLAVIGAAATEDHVVTGGAGLARGLARARRGVRPTAPAPDVAVPTAGRTVVLAGSCSETTVRQVHAAAAVVPSHRLDPAAATSRDDLMRRVRVFLADHVEADAVMVYSSASRADRQATDSAFGGDTAHVLEQTMGRIAVEVVQSGVRRLVVAGGETAGAVVEALGIDSMVVAEELDAGVPWCVTRSEPSVGLLLKSGNFGRDDVFLRAFGPRP